jgi:hypothetical protein
MWTRSRPWTTASSWRSCSSSRGSEFAKDWMSLFDRVRLRESEFIQFQGDFDKSVSFHTILRRVAISRARAKDFFMSLS